MIVEIYLYHIVVGTVIDMNTINSIIHQMIHSADELDSEHTKVMIYCVIRPLYIAHSAIIQLDIDSYRLLMHSQHHVLNLMRL